ncbi:hypothetical protein ACPESV_17300 [Streptomyces umbrinus]|uniref:hypothetical protein n=1 Tax=Streptomyces umbrinus TaxID=67370 RepID=UPI003C2B4E04
MTTFSTPVLPDELQTVTDTWATAPSAHPHLGDWRFVGYHRGRKQIGTPTTIVTAEEVGVPADGEADVSKPLQRAVDELGRTGGGMLRLSAGRYRLDRPLLMRHSNVVLRGAGKEHTTLHFPRPLAESVGPAVSSDGVSSGWSWNGGQVFFISPQRFARSSAADWAFTEPHTEGWLAGDVLADVGPARRGATVLVVGSTSGIHAGDMVLLEMDNDPDHCLLRHMAGDVEGAVDYAWSTRAATIAGPARFTDFTSWRWPVRVVEVVGSTAVRLEQPLKLPIEAPGRAVLRDLGPTVHDSGVEDLTIENELREQTAHNLNPGSNGVGFQAVHDCWARNVHVVNADMAFGMTSAKSCTLSGISAGGRSLHHFVACRVQSHDNLVEDFELDEFTVPAVPGSYLHGLNVEGLSSGNVYRRGVLHTGTFDSHRQMPFENLRTAITVTNKDAVPGGALDAGPYFGTRSVHWGIHVTNGNNLCIEITDVAPRSLTAGITGLDRPGSILPRAGMDFSGALESQAIAFGVDLGEARDLLEVQRAAAPFD